jgi:hypothetical protein
MINHNYVIQKLKLKEKTKKKKKNKKKKKGLQPASYEESKTQPTECSNPLRNPIHVSKFHHKPAS